MQKKGIKRLLKRMRHDELIYNYIQFCEANKFKATILGYRRWIHSNERKKAEAAAAELS